MKRFFIRFLRKSGILKRITIYPNLKFEGVQITIPIINEVGVSNYLHLSEPWMQFVLKKLYNREKTFLDVGINLGQTLIKLKSVEKDAGYIGFEPNPLCVNYANELISKNSFSNVTVFPVGISESSSVLKLNLFDEAGHDSSASIVEEFRDKSKIKKTLNVPVFSWSDLDVVADKKIGIVKIDVEGAELEVLNGIKSVLESDRPYVLIEVLPVYSEDNTFRLERQKKIENILSDCNYKIYRINKKGDMFEKITSLETIGIHSDLQMCEYVFTPEEFAKDVEQLLIKP